MGGRKTVRGTAEHAAAGRGRFPGFDVLGQAGHWDQATAAVVIARTGVPPAIRFFTPAEQAAAIALCDRLLDQPGPGSSSFEQYVPVVHMIDTRLAEAQTDGWRYQDMPEDGQAWRDSLAALDEDATARFGRVFASCSLEQQSSVIQAVQDQGSDAWHGMPAAHVWSLWTRYACTAFYAHPSAWSEIGFPGPAYPRGYKNPGVNRRESFEVRDTRPSEDPTEADPAR
jgi:hypothetical protein